LVEKIKIGNKIYRVVVDDAPLNGRGIVGEINFYKTEIIVSPRLGAQSLCETLVHEAVHGMLEFMGEREKSEAEDTVNRITSGILMLVRDNPELFLKFARSE